MADVLGGGWYCRSCETLYGVPDRKRSPPLAKALLRLGLRLIYVTAVTMTAGFGLVTLALTWPLGAGGPAPFRGFDPDLRLTALAIPGVFTLFALSTWAGSRRSWRSLVAAVISGAFFAGLGGFMLEDGQAYQALKIGAAGACLGLIVWSLPYGLFRRPERAS